MKGQVKKQMMRPETLKAELQSMIEWEGEVADDFEREVESELSSTLELCKASFSKTVSSDALCNIACSSSSATDCKRVQENDKYYDDVYFDSDDSGSEESLQKYSGLEGNRGNKQVLSNGELFYDPKMDDDDQEWINKLRGSYKIKDVKRSGCVPKGTKNCNSTPSSDAVLNCPACLTMLCMDCQRHEVYHNQYRAMFVFNCRVKWNELLKFPKKDGKKKKSSKSKKLLQKHELLSSTGHQVDSVADGKSSEKTEEVLERSFLAKDITSKANCVGEEHEYVCNSSNVGDRDDELFHPVLCSICNTKVAVYDKEEVYHFFNVLSSH